MLRIIVTLLIVCHLHAEIGNPQNNGPITDKPIPIEVSHFGDDAIGGQLSSQITTLIQQSLSMMIVTNTEKPFPRIKLTIMTTAISPELPDSGSAISWTICARSEQQGAYALIDQGVIALSFVEPGGLIPNREI